MEKKLIFLTQEKSTFFLGSGRLTVVYGECNIFGANISQDMDFFTEFYSKQYSFEIVCLESGNQKKKINFKEKKFLQPFEKELNSKNLKQISCVIYFEYDQLEFTKSDKKIRINEDLLSEETLKSNILIHTFDQKFYLSTYILNTILQTKKEVTLINLDPNINGIISVSKYNRPLLVPYWKILDFDQSLFLGNLKYEDDLDIFYKFSSLLLSNMKKEQLVIISPSDNLPIFDNIKNLSSINATDFIESKMIHDNFFPYYFLSSKVEKIPFKIFLIALSESIDDDILSDIMYLLNGATIALSKIDKKLKNDTSLPLFTLSYPAENVYGFGIIRKIDIHNSYFYIESPLESLSEMNLMFVGKINDQSTFATYTVELKNKGMSGVMTKKKVGIREASKNIKGRF